jgi:hypothetical protein
MTHGHDAVHESGQVEATEILHGDNPTDLHFRYLGTAKGRQFVVNVQFDSHDGKTGERLKPIEHAFMVVKVLGLILERVTNKPDSGLH